MTVYRFLLVSLNIEAILAEVTIRKRRKKLEEMERGNGLSHAYTVALKRLKAQDESTSTLGMTVLMWVLHSERPLRAEELRHALGVELGSTDLDIDNLPALRILLSSCLGLITSVPNRPVRTPGPWRPIVPSVPGRVGKDGRARRPSSIMTAVL